MDITPEQVRRMEESRLRAKALRSQPPTPKPVAGQKRSHSAISSNPPTSSVRDARGPSTNNGLSAAKDDGIQAARKFKNFVEYDFSKMTDTKGGFMTAEDDPHNKALYSEQKGKPAGMSLKEWERQQLQKKLRDRRQGPYEPGLSVLDKREITKKCRECGSLEIDWTWDEVLRCQVCHTCKEKLPEKYSLLTKTEAKDDYLLTDPELKDDLILPHLNKPNPHNSTYHDMMLYVRYQLEDFAFQKWGGEAALDEEFQRRKDQQKANKEKKFRSKLNELKKRTRVEAYKRARRGGGGDFGDTIGRGRHEHEWGRTVEDPESGVGRKSCVECGMVVEEMDL
ncbi:DNA repair protein [Teratosphaeria nubilosa]|uniref:DNA repair protein RAD14 n=1 Tax=Teratosphaeria nubilosa TaxID=161662 RepID=A0A6G1L1M4_9PEZI|nr:DNA repair protein [Teratosphaeria nubilosa]